jgi:hypothetical protein
MPIYITPPYSGTTSGTSNFTANRDEVIKRSLRMVGAYTSTDLPRPEQLTDACTILNIMLKAWQIEGFQWLRTFVTIPLVASQNSYQLGPASTTPMDRPTHIFSATRKSSSGNEIPLTAITRQDWMSIPNKTTTATPVQYYYDPFTINGTLYVWPTPQVGTTDSIVLDCDIQLDIMEDSLNDFDFPPQWLECITYNLAARIAPEYGLPLAERALLDQQAASLLVKMQTDDRDVASVYFGVRR